MCSVISVSIATAASLCSLKVSNSESLSITRLVYYIIIRWVNYIINAVPISPKLSKD